MDRYPSRYHNDSHHHGYQPSFYSFGNGYRDDERDDRVRRPVKEDRRDDRDRDRDRVHDRAPERSYVEREGKRNDLYDKEDRKDRYKRPKEDPYAPISQKDTMELNIELQLTIKSIKKELYDNREEMKHMQGLLDDERHENNKLKREISDLKEEVENRKQQIKAERAHRDTLFKENQFVIDKLEAEIKKLRYPPPPVLPHITPSISLHSSAPFPPRNSPSSDIPLQKKQLIASNADRCLWLSMTSLSSQEVYEALGGAGIVENVYVTSRFSAFITFFSTEKAQEAAAQARALFCHQNGVRCNIVNNSLWVGNVHTSEEELREACEYCGEVESIKLMASTHCAFVSFKDTSAAITACSNLDGTFLNSSRLVVNFKYKFTEEGSSTTFFNYPVGKVLYVGDLDATEEELYGLFETFGQILDVWTPLTGDYAFITFTTVESAVVAKYHLHGRRLGATCLKINYRKGNEDPSFMYSETLAIKTNPPVNGEEQLRSFLAKYAKNNYHIEYKKINHKWIVRMGSGEEGIIVKAHLDSRTVSGVHFDVKYIFTKPKLEMDY